MQSKLSILSTRGHKTGLILLISIFAFTGINTCFAQSIVGKWNQLKIKTYYTAEGAKENGNHTESEIDMSTIGKGLFVFYSNHTYRQESSTGDSKTKTIQGTWSMSGNELTMTLLALQDDPKDNPKKDTPPEKTIVSFKGDIMEWTRNLPDNKTISKIVLTLAKNS
jgi:hypothetical protein